MDTRTILSIARVTGYSHLEIQSFSFIQFWQEFPEDVVFYFFFFFFAKSNLQTLKTAHFPFLLADVSCFVFNWEVQERHASCIIPLAGNQQCITCFWKCAVWYIKRRREYQNKYIFFKCRLWLLWRLEKWWQTAFADLSAYSSRKRILPPRLHKLLF